MSLLARRSVLTGLTGVPLAAILADPRLAALAAEGLETVTAKTSDDRQVSAELAVPDSVPAPAVLLIHEWWGLNNQIRAVTTEFAREGFVALAVDLFDGKVATAAEDAQRLTQAVDPEQATGTLTAWVDWLKADSRTTGKVGVVGWCFGGGWALNASIAAPVDATVIYYGRVERTAEDLAKLNGPVLGHFAEQDQWINQEMVGRFEAAMEEAGKSLEVHWYSANHAFANPTGANYDREDAQQAWTRTLEFFRQNLS